MHGMTNRFQQKNMPKAIHASRGGISMHHYTPAIQPGLQRSAASSDPHPLN